MTVSGGVQDRPMEPKENNYRVTGRLTIDFQIIMQALDSDEAELVANQTVIIGESALI